METLSTEKILRTTSGNFVIVFAQSLSSSDHVDEPTFSLVISFVYFASIEWSSTGKSTT